MSQLINRRAGLIIVSSAIVCIEQCLADVNPVILYLLTVDGIPVTKVAGIVIHIQRSRLAIAAAFETSRSLHLGFIELRSLTDSLISFIRPE